MNATATKETPTREDTLNKDDSSPNGERTLSSYTKLKIALLSAKQRLALAKALTRQATANTATNISPEEKERGRNIESPMTKIGDEQSFNYALPIEQITTTHSATLVQSTRHRGNAAGWIVGICAIVATIIIATLMLRHKAHAAVDADAANADASSRSTTANVLSAEQRAAIEVEVVQKRSVQEDVSAAGKVAFNGNRVSSVFSQFNGRLTQLNAEVGMNVRAGQVIGMIDTPDIVATQSDYQQSLAAERSARTTLDLATRTHERAARLAAAEAIPARESQQAEADELRARDDLQRAQTAAVAARGRLQSAGVSEAEIAQLASGARAINRLVPLTAPISGVVIERKAGLGQVVQPAAGDPLLMIADLSTVWINMDVYEDQLASIRSGAPVQIKTPAYPNQIFVARVDQIGSVLDPDKHTVPVRCVVVNRNNQLKPGMFATAILPSAASHEALTVPATALITEGDKRAVFIEETPGRYAKREVVTGDEVNGAVIVRSGLSDGEHVVVRGSLLLSAQQAD